MMLAPEGIDMRYDRFPEECHLGRPNTKSHGQDDVAKTNGQGHANSAGGKSGCDGTTHTHPTASEWNECGKGKRRGGEEGRRGGGVPVPPAGAIFPEESAGIRTKGPRANKSMRMAQGRRGGGGEAGNSIWKWRIGKAMRTHNGRRDNKTEGIGQSEKREATGLGMVQTSREWSRSRSKEMY